MNLFFFFILLLFLFYLLRERRYLSDKLSEKEAEIRENEAILKTFLKNTSSGVYLLKDKNLLSPNTDYLDKLGYSMEDFLSKDFSFLIHPEHRQMVLDRVIDRYAGKDVPTRYELKLLSENGQTVWVDLSAVLVSYKGEPAIFGSFFDISERKTRELIREGILNILRKVSSNIPGIIYKYHIKADLNISFPFISEKVREIFGLCPEELAKDARPIFDLLHPDDRHFARVFVKRSEKGSGFWKGQFRMRHLTGEYRWYEAKSSIERRKDSSIIWYGYLVDVQEWRETQDHIMHMALHDPLTSLPNRIFFEKNLERAIAEAERKEEIFALLFMDLDHFKEVNDEFGHETGDKLLRCMALKLKESIRKSDMVARIGGDEFVLLLSDLSSPDDALSIADKLRLKVAEPCKIGENTFNISVSMGISLYPEHGIDLINLTRYADRAMYHSKNMGRNMVSLYKEI